ncbi:MAG: DUF1540 domain-containing protein [Bacillota bacterium]
MTDVRCTVRNCAYWGTSNVCEARAIKVSTDSSRGYDMEIGELGERESTSSRETQCVTFKPR